MNARRRRRDNDFGQTLPRAKPVRKRGREESFNDDRAPNTYTVIIVIVLF